MLSEPTLRLLEVAGQWVSGVGALAAVLVSLYLARRQEAVRLRVSAGVRLSVERGSEETPEYVVIRVVNLGYRPVTVSAIGWRVGLFHKHLFYQILDGEPPSPRVPIEMAVGQEANFMILLDRWLEASDMAKEFGGPLAPLRAWTTKVQVVTAVGETVSKRIEKNLRKKLLGAK
jgi:hypothetical protein